jgi:hypothetical protein
LCSRVSSRSTTTRTFGQTNRQKRSSSFRKIVAAPTGSNRLLGGKLAGQKLVPISLIANNPLKVEQRAHDLNSSLLAI